MTREEAIARIKDHMEHHGIRKYPHIMLSEALDMAISALTPPNEPLTLEELRGMNGSVWVACKPIEGGNGYWCLCRYGTITTPAATVFDAEEIPHWVFYRRPPEVSP